MVRYELLQRAAAGARLGRLHTRAGVVDTPAFMPVATHAHVRGMNMTEVATTGAQMCLANTYHLLLRPGPEVVAHFGGVHRFMQWPHGVLTDSGGFQIFSLAGFREVSEAGARFRSPYDNHSCFLSPESSIATQQALSSDVMMVLDVCPPSTAPLKETRDAMERTHRWALRSLAAKNSKDTGQALFAIVQGGVFEALRTQSAQFLTEHPFDGFAIGGLAVGESRELLYAMCGHTAPQLPVDRARYLMGVGTPIDLVECVNVGVDMFDCILPTKMAQGGYAYTFEGTLRLARSEYQMANGPVEEGCPCLCCQRYERGYIRHLTHGNHTLAAQLLSMHNLVFYQRLMARMRRSLEAGTWSSTYATLRDALAPQKSAPVAMVGGRLGNFELVTVKSGERSVRHQGHGEVMHPSGPWAEANALYIEQSTLAAKLKARGDEPVRILDVGLGVAANALAAFAAARALGAERLRPLEIVSLEHDVGAVKLALSDEAGFPFLKQWRGACEALLDQGRWDSESLSWRLITGDASTGIDEADGYFDFIFFDPYSPEQNPELWTQAFLRQIRSRSRNDGTQLMTYSSTTPTRVALLLAGFFVGPGGASGSRSETTLASTRPELLPSLLGERWLIQWQRSDSRAPHGEPWREEIEAAVLGHPQFRSIVG